MLDMWQEELEEANLTMTEILFAKARLVLLTKNDRAKHDHNHGLKLTKMYSGLSDGGHTHDGLVKRARL